MLRILGNPYRLQIVSILSTGEKNVSELNRNIKLSQPALSQHLSKLRGGGWLRTRREQRQIYYRIRDPKLFDLMEAMRKLAYDGKNKD
jgi:ArsR family transcriptional regulator, virulence genes transcriptional regulator